MLGRSELPGLLLLRDLRELHLTAQAAEISWVVLTAWAARAEELVSVASSCHEETEACAKWLRTRIKEASPQILATG